MNALAVEDQPQTLRDHQLMRRIPLGRTAFYKRKARGEFRFLEITPQLPDGPTLYSRSKVTRWLNGELQEPELLVRFFGKARRAPESRRPVGRPRKGNQVARELSVVRHTDESGGDNR